MVSGQWSEFKNLILLFLLITLHLSLPTVFYGCQQEGMPPQPSSQQEIKKTQRVEAALPAAEIKQEQKKEEPPVEIKERNPFKPFITTKVEKPIVPRTPLQRYELDQLKLVAVIWGIANPTAMVEAPDGKGYSIKKGDLIGSRGGRVKRIEKDKIVVEERFTEDGGEVITSEFIISLPLPKGEEESR